MSWQLALFLAAWLGLFAALLLWPNAPYWRNPGWPRNLDGDGDGA